MNCKKRYRYKLSLMSTNTPGTEPLFETHYIRRNPMTSPEISGVNSIDLVSIEGLWFLAMTYNLTSFNTKSNTTQKKKITLNVCTGECNEEDLSFSVTDTDNGMLEVIVWDENKGEKPRERVLDYSFPDHWTGKFDEDWDGADILSPGAVAAPANKDTFSLVTANGCHYAMKRYDYDEIIIDIAFNTDIRSSVAVNWTITPWDAEDADIFTVNNKQSGSELWIGAFPRDLG